MIRRELFTVKLLVAHPWVRKRRHGSFLATRIFLPVSEALNRMHVTLNSMPYQSIDLRWQWQNLFAEKKAGRRNRNNSIYIIYNFMIPLISMGTAPYYSAIFIPQHIYTSNVEASLLLRWSTTRPSSELPSVIVKGIVDESAMLLSILHISHQYVCMYPFPFTISCVSRNCNQCLTVMYAWFFFRE